MHVTIYSASWCSYCKKVKQYLTEKKIEFSVIDIDEYPEKMEEVINKYGAKTLPQIFLNETLIGGCEDTIDYFNTK